MELGRMKGNIDRPTVEMIPTALSDDPAKAAAARRGGCPSAPSGAREAQHRRHPHPRSVLAIVQPGPRAPRRGGRSGLDGPAMSVAPSMRKPSRPDGHKGRPRQRAPCWPGPQSADAAPLAGHASSALIVSQAAPCSTSMATDSRPHSRVNGVNRPRNVPRRWCAGRYRGGRARPAAHCRPPPRTPAPGRSRRRTAPSPRPSARP